MINEALQQVMTDAERDQLITRLCRLVKVQQQTIDRLLDEVVRISADLLEASKRIVRLEQHATRDDKVGGKVH